MLYLCSSYNRLVNYHKFLFLLNNSQSLYCESLSRVGCKTQFRTGILIFMKPNYIPCNVGDKFNSLTILSREPRNSYGALMVRCLCDCGNIIISKEYLVKKGIRKSCGCKNNYWHTHGMWNSPEWISYMSMKDRCTNKNNRAYNDYAGRGILVCDRWLESFENFYEDMGKRPSPKHSIDRIDNSKGYEPGNCRWADYRTQNNNRRSSRYLKYKGKTQSIAQWARELGINKTTLLDRLKTMDLNKAATFVKETHRLIDYDKLKKLTDEGRTTGFIAKELNITFFLAKKALKFHNLKAAPRKFLKSEIILR